MQVTCMHAALTESPHLVIDQGADEPEEQGPPPLDVVLLQQPCQEGEGLPSHQEGGVPEAGRDVRNVGVHLHR